MYIFFNNFNIRLLGSDILIFDRVFKTKYVFGLYIARSEKKMAFKK